MHPQTIAAHTKRLAELLKGIESAMFTNINSDGSVVSRPMLAQEAEFTGTLHFFCSHSSGRVDTIQRGSHISLSFVDPSTNRFLSVNGSAEVIVDPKQIKKNWNAGFEKWFPAGLAEEDLVLVAVSVSYAEFWDTPNSEVSETFCFLSPDSSAPERPRLSVSQ